MIGWLRYFWNKYIVKKGLGFVRQAFDDRDYKFKNHVEISGTPPQEHIIPFEPNIRDQGIYNSCTGFAVAKLVEYQLYKTYGTMTRSVSPLFSWHMTKKIHGWPETNNGVWLRYSLKSLLNDGFVYEGNHPYVKDFYREPSDGTKLVGTTTAKMYFPYWTSYLLLDVGDALNSLAADIPFVFGIDLNKSFYSTKDGIIKDEEPMNSSHAMFCYGYKMIGDQKHFVCANSWGKKRGDKGIFYIPESYFMKHAHDIWTILELPERRKYRLLFNVAGTN